MASMMGSAAQSGEFVWINFDRVSRIIELQNGVRIVFSGPDDFIDIKSTMNQIMNGETFKIR